MKDNGIRKMWVKKGEAWHCMAYRAPYRQEKDAIKKGLPLEVWVNTPVLDTDQYHDPPVPFLGTDMPS